MLPRQPPLLRPRPKKAPLALKPYFLLVCFRSAFFNNIPIYRLAFAFFFFPSVFTTYNRLGVWRNFAHAKDFGNESTFMGDAANGMTMHMTYTLNIRQRLFVFSVLQTFFTLYYGTNG